MAAQVTLPPQAPTTTAGWTHTQLFNIRDNVLRQMELKCTLPTVPYDATFPHGDQAATELGDACGNIFMIIMDPVAGIITFTPDVDGIKAREDAKVARPKNCFVIYRLDKHPLIKALNPDMGNNDISKVSGNMWQLEPQSVKDEYKRRAEEEKRQHAILHPGWKYQPRKPSEKKKRMTKNKLAKLAASRRAAQVAAPRAQQQQPLPALPELHIDTFVSMTMTDELAMAPTGPASRKYKHKHAQPRPVEQKRQEVLDDEPDMEDFFAFDAAAGPIASDFNMTGSWEATWATPQQ